MPVSVNLVINKGSCELYLALCRKNIVFEMINDLFTFVVGIEIVY